MTENVTNMLLAQLLLDRAPQPAATPWQAAQQAELTGGQVPWWVVTTVPPISPFWLNLRDINRPFQRQLEEPDRYYPGRPMQRGPTRPRRSRTPEPI
jgi:hypothetical protein